MENGFFCFWTLPGPSTTSLEIEQSVWPVLFLEFRSQAVGFLAIAERNPTCPEVLLRFFCSAVFRCRFRTAIGHFNQNLETPKSCSRNNWKKTHSKNFEQTSRTTRNTAGLIKRLNRIVKRSSKNGSFSAFYFTNRWCKFKIIFDRFWRFFVSICSFS